MNITDMAFNEKVLESELPSLVDFWATWCGPCRRLAPIVEEIEKEFEGKINVFKLDVDENPKISTNYGVRSIPTLLLFKDGKVVKTIIGLQSKEKIVASIEEVLITKEITHA